VFLLQIGDRLLYAFEEMGEQSIKSAAGGAAQSLLRDLATSTQ
jgi:hypothetical protein